tara:strand:- start:317 stop:811 length:495 start_codon:yes stop_codon:yes gene_type:complete
MALTKIADGGMPAGAMLQVVQTVKTDTFSSNPSSSFVDITGMSVAITPSSSSSKILVQINLVGGGLTAVNEAKFRLVRGSTVIYAGASAGNRTVGYGAFIADDAASTGTSTGMFLDSPSSTSATTYKVQVFSNNTVYINRTSSDSDDANRFRGASTITVMEIAG